jgi:hypothetical protein
MPQQILLGPQTPVANIRQAVDASNTEGPIVVITAGWRDSEGEIDELREELGQAVDDLMLYHRAEEIYENEPNLRQLKRERQDKLRELQGLYRLRLSPTLSAARNLLDESGDPDLLRLEQRSAITQIRTLDRHHLHRIIAIHREYDARRELLQIPTVTAQHEQVHAQIENASLVLIAGGHVAVLLNRLRMFRLEEILAKKSIVAWSAGAMSLSDRIVLFHHHAPQGKVDAELLDVGLGIVKKKILLPDAKHRLAWSDRKRMALFSRRFSPATCCTLDNGSMIHMKQGTQVSVADSFVVTRSGRKKALKTR